MTTLLGFEEFSEKERELAEAAIFFAETHSRAHLGTQSPIERDLARCVSTTFADASTQILRRYFAMSRNNAPGSPRTGIVCSSEAILALTGIHTQVPVGRFKCDLVFEFDPRHSLLAHLREYFCMPAPADERVRIYVECDGHEFHARTKDQVARDLKRNRYFTREGKILLRFTGSEIHNESPSCCKEVVSLACSLINQKEWLTSAS